MNKGMIMWEFLVRELKSLQQETVDPQPIVELYVEQILLRGYNISKRRG
jgi:hypothetical protein